VEFEEAAHGGSFNHGSGIHRPRTGKALEIDAEMGMKKGGRDEKSGKDHYAITNLKP
jgi:hypothetical protein